MTVSSLPVGMIGTNCYIVCDETQKVCAVIDPGDEAERIAAQVEKTGCKPVMILLTHGHFDHVTAVPQLLRLWPGLPVYLNGKDQAEAECSSIAHTSMGKVNSLRLYGEGDTVALGSLTVEVMETPGHTPGSVTLKIGDALFTGDTLFRTSCGRTDLPGGSYPDMVASLQRLAKLPGDYKVYPGHDRATTLDQERQYNFALSDAMSYLS